MLSQIYTIALIFLSGFISYSAVNHFTMGRHQPQDRAHLLFAGMCLAMTLYILPRVMELRATTIDGGLSALRLCLACVILFLSLLPWFFVTV
jgi:hypothetical protein